ncbi:hypothetical protein ACERZ8_21305 [Tateyamaria armeniaca]|uniref:Oligosaccharide repeat unit polymerase n=1 Tax=Tateyamaria armeniaca TaxID=2518930 RepID=A0ABW8V4L2_9RHOB
MRHLLFLNLGRVAYSVIKESRDDALNFATGLVVVCGAAMLLSLSILQRVQGISPRIKRLALIICLLTVLFVSIWQLLSASRVEAIGLLFGLFLTQGDRVSRFTRRTSIFVVIVLFGLVGYLRQLLSVSSYLDRSFVSWPGGIENVFNTYVFALISVRDGDLPVFFGQTYLDLLQRLPPGFFGLDRPPRAYDYLAERTRLIGGEYFLTEPFMNGLGLGVAIFLCVLVFILNSSTRVLADFHQHPRRIFAALISMTVLTFSFRIMWYGFEHTLKTIVIGCILALPLLALGQRLRKRLQTRPQAHSQINSNL